MSTPQLKRKVVNKQEEVIRGDGTQLYGLDAEIELKMQSKRDPEFERQLLTWIEDATGIKAEYPDSIEESLKDGILLCELINKIWPGTIKAINRKKIALMEMENIQYYLKACWKLGIPSPELFVVSDLYLKKGVPAVITNVYSIARLAANTPSWTGPRCAAWGKSAEERGITPGAVAKKWAGVNTSVNIVKKDEYINEVEEPEPEPDSPMCSKCHLKITNPNVRFCVACGGAVVKPPSLRIKELEDQNSTLNKEISSLKEVKSKLEKELGRLQDMAKETARKQEEREKAEEKLYLIEQEREKEREREREKERENMKKEISKAKSKKEKAAKQRDQLQTELNALKADLAKANEAKKKDSDLISQLKDDISRLQKQADSISKGSKSEKSAIADELAQAQSENQKLKRQIEELNLLKEQNLKLQKEVENAIKEKENAKKEDAKEIKRLKKLVEEAEGIKEQNNKLQKNIEFLTRDKEDAIKDKEKILQESKEESQKLKGQLEEANKFKDKTTELEKNIEKLKKEKENSMIEIKEREEIKKNDLEEIQKLKKQLEETNKLRDQVERLQKDLDLMKKECSQAKKDLETAKKSGGGGGASKEELEKLKAENAKLKEDLKKSKIQSTIPGQDKDKDKDKIHRGKDLPAPAPAPAPAPWKNALAQANATPQFSRKTIRMSPEEKAQKLNMKRQQTVKHPVRKTVYIKKTDEDFIAEVIRSCMNSVPVDIEKTMKLAQMFQREEHHRRAFTAILKSELKYASTNALDNDSFESLLFFVNILMQQIDRADGGKDYIAAIVIWRACNVVRRSFDDKTEYLSLFMKDFEIWQDVGFWEENFMEELKEEHKFGEGSGKDLEQDDFNKMVPELMNSFGVSMLEWRVPAEKVQTFMKETFEKFAVSPSSYKPLKVPPKDLETTLRSLTKK